MTAPFHAVKPPRMRGGLCHLGGLLLAVGCSTAGPQEQPVPDITPFITPRLAAVLDANGLFALPQTGQQPGEISAVEAKQLAQDWVRLYAPSVLEGLERQYGGKINLGALAPCGDAYYASSSFQPLPPDIPAVYHRGFGSWWMVPLCTSNVPQVQLAVNAGAGFLFDIHAGRMPGNGALVVRGNEYRWAGIPNGRFADRFLTAEQAIAVVANWAHERVAAVPELVVGREGPFFVRWKVSLDRPVSARRAASGESVATTEFYVGPILDREHGIASGKPTTVAAASVLQPDSTEFLYVTDEARARGMPYENTKGVARRRPDRALALDPVVH